jgi:hypothetical protein
MPDPTDFVTDLPADFEIFGDAVDTTLEAIETKLDVITTEGDLIVGDASGEPVRLPIGTAGQLLVSDGDTAEWATFSSGGMTLIASANPSAATTVSFTSIPTSFKSLIVVWTDVRQSITTGYFSVRLNNSTTNANYAFAARGALNSGTASNVITTTFEFESVSLFGTNQSSGVVSSHDTSGGTEFLRGHGSFEIFGADLTTAPKIVQWQSQGSKAGTSIGIFGDGRYSETAAITQIDFIRNSTQTITGTFRLYGIS